MAGAIMRTHPVGSELGHAAGIGSEAVGCAHDVAVSQAEVRIARTAYAEEQAEWPRWLLLARLDPNVGRQVRSGPNLGHREPGEPPTLLFDRADEDERRSRRPPVTGARGVGGM